MTAKNTVRDCFTYHSFRYIGAMFSHVGAGFPGLLIQFSLVSYTGAMLEGGEVLPGKVTQGWQLVFSGS